MVANSYGGGSNIYELNGSCDGDSATNVGGVAFIEDKDDGGGFDFNDRTNRQLDRGEEVRALEREKNKRGEIEIEEEETDCWISPWLFAGGTSLLDIFEHDHKAVHSLLVHWK